MKVRDIYNSLVTGDLKHIALADIPLSEFDYKQSNRLITFINDSLRDIYTKYIISEKSVFIESKSHKSKYSLTYEYARMNLDSPIAEENRYLLDTPNNLFIGNVIKVIAVYNQVGNKLPLNDSQQWASVFTSKSNEIQLTHPLDGQVFEIVYQALHDKLEVKETIEETMDQYVEIPFPLVEALICRVAFRYFNSLGGQQFTNKSQELLMRYESIIDTIEYSNSIHSSDVDTNVKLLLRGYP